MIQKAITNDKNFFWGVTSLVLIVAASPYLFGLLLTPAGYQFQGNTVLAPGDPNVYYSYIEQARQGAWIMRDVFTSEPHQATLWQPVWLVLGWLANLFHLSTPAVYVVGRLASVILFTTTTWWAIRRICNDNLTRRIAFGMVVGAAGLGGMVVVIGNLTFNNLLELPPDVWVSEMLPLLSAWTSPHFLLVTSGIVYVLTSIQFPSQQKTRSQWWLIGLVSLFTLSIHPFHVATFGLLWLGMTMFYWKRERIFPLSYVLRWGGVLLASLPALMYYAVGLVADPIVIGRASQNINPTPPVWMMLVGVGLVLPLAVFGYFRLRKTNPLVAQWLGLWAVVQVLLSYAPFDGQRRLLQAIIIPLALLASPAILYIWQKNRQLHWRRWALIVGGIVVLGGSPIVAGHGIMNDYYLERQGRNHWEYYLRPEYQALFLYAKRSIAPELPILASVWNSNLIAGFSARTVVAGHPVETLHYSVKHKTVQRFFQSMTKAEQAHVLRQYNVCYILYGPREQAYGRAFQPTDWSDLVSVWSGPTMTLYRLTSCLSAR